MSSICLLRTAWDYASCWRRTRLNDNFGVITIYVIIDVDDDLCGSENIIKIFVEDSSRLRKLLILCIGENRESMISFILISERNQKLICEKCIGYHP